MYRRAKFVEILLEIREEMAHEADYDVVLFVERVRNGDSAPDSPKPKRMANPRSHRRRVVSPAGEPEPAAR